MWFYGEGTWMRSSGQTVWSINSCDTAKGIFIAKDLKLGVISRKKNTFFIFQEFEVFFYYFLKLNISVTWRAREASLGSFCSIFYPLSNGVLVKFIRVQIKKLQLFKNFKNAIFAKSAILAIFYFAPMRVPMHSKGHIYTKGP